MVTELRSWSRTPKGQRVLLGTRTALCYITKMRDGNPVQESRGDKDGDRGEAGGGGVNGVGEGWADLGAVETTRQGLDEEPEGRKGLTFIR